MGIIYYKRKAVLSRIKKTGQKEKAGKPAFCQAFGGGYNLLQLYLILDEIW